MLPLACQGINITRVLYFASWGVTNHVWHAKQLDQTAPDILFTCPALTNYEFPVPTGRYCTSTYQVRKCVPKHASYLILWDYTKEDYRPYPTKSQSVLMYIQMKTCGWMVVVRKLVARFVSAGNWWMIVTSCFHVVSPHKTNNKGGDTSGCMCYLHYFHS